MERKGPEGEGTREKAREREREGARKMGAKIEARGRNQAAMEDPTIRDTAKSRDERASPDNISPGEEGAEIFPGDGGKMGNRERDRHE